ncbi:MAG: hypothetical protein K2X39_02280 [Silvanigrellaceae bacterium]|nr:hypothetical protein [Silvanigrellaceae bacterium]
MQESILINNHSFLASKSFLVQALTKANHSPLLMQKLVNFYLTYLELIEPSQALRESSRLLKTLNCFPCGVKKSDLLVEFYEGYMAASPARRESLRICLEKLIQRTRKHYQSYGLNIFYCKNSQLYFVIMEYV